MNTGVCSLSLLQGISPPLESTQGLLHCRQILYQLNYQGEKIIIINYQGSPSVLIHCCINWYNHFGKPFLSIELNDLVIQLLSVHSTEMHSSDHPKTCIRMFIAALFIKAQN